MVFAVRGGGWGLGSRGGVNAGELDLGDTTDCEDISQDANPAQVGGGVLKGVQGSSAAVQHDKRDAVSEHDMGTRSAVRASFRQRPSERGAVGLRGVCVARQLAERLRSLSAETETSMTALQLGVPVFLRLLALLELRFRLVKHGLGVRLCRELIMQFG